MKTTAFRLDFGMDEPLSMATWLENLSEKGLILRRFRLSWGIFSREEPQFMRYQVLNCPQDEQADCLLRAGPGWELVGRWGGAVILRAPRRIAGGPPL